MDTQTLQHLNHQREWVALEAEVASGTFDVAGLVDRFLPQAKELFAGFVSRFSPSDPAIALTRDQREFMRVIEAVKYLDLAPTTAYVPQGLEATYLDYLNMLGPAVDYAVKAGERLSTYTAFLAMLLTNRDHRFSAQDNAVIYKEMERTRAGLNQDLGSCFNSTHVAESRYDKVVARNSDWTQVFHSLEKITTEVNRVDRKQLQKNAHDASDLMSKLIDVIQRNEMNDSSPNVVLEMADGAFQIASELEFYATIYYRVLALATAVNETTFNIKRIFKQ